MIKQKIFFQEIFFDSSAWFKFVYVKIFYVFMTN